SPRAAPCRPWLARVPLRGPLPVTRDRPPQRPVRLVCFPSSSITGGARHTMKHRASTGSRAGRTSRRGLTALVSLALVVGGTGPVASGEPGVPAEPGAPTQATAQLLEQGTAEPGTPAVA